MDSDEIAYERFEPNTTFFTNQHQIRIYMTEDKDERVTRRRSMRRPTRCWCTCGEGGECVCNWTFEMDIDEHPTFESLLSTIVKKWKHHRIRAQRTHVSYKTRLLASAQGDKRRWFSTVNRQSASKL